MPLNPTICPYSITDQELFRNIKDLASIIQCKAADEMAGWNLPSELIPQDSTILQLGMPGHFRTGFQEKLSSSPSLVFFRSAGKGAGEKFYRGVGTGKPLALKSKSSQAHFTNGAIAFLLRLSKKKTWSDLQGFKRDQGALISLLSSDFVFVPVFITQAEFATDKQTKTLYKENTPFDISDKAAYPDIQSQGDKYFLRKRNFAEIRKELGLSLGESFANKKMLSTFNRNGVRDDAIVYQVYINERYVLPQDDNGFWGLQGNRTLLDKYAPQFHYDVSGGNFRAVSALAQVIGNAFFIVIGDYDTFAVCPSVHTFISSNENTFSSGAGLGSGGIYNPVYKYTNVGIASRFENKTRRKLNRAAIAASQAVWKDLEPREEEELGLPREEAFKTILHGCEVNNYFATVPLDFDTLFVNSYPVSQQPVNAFPAWAAFFEMALGLPVSLLEPPPEIRAVTKDQDLDFMTLIKGLKNEWVYQNFIFPINLNWGIFEIKAGQKYDPQGKPILESNFVQSTAIYLHGRLKDNTFNDGISLLEAILKKHRGSVERSIKDQILYIQNSNTEINKVAQLLAVVVNFSLKLIYLYQHYSHLSHAIIKYYNDYQIHHAPTQEEKNLKAALKDKASEQCSEAQRTIVDYMNILIQQKRTRYILPEIREQISQPSVIDKLKQALVNRIKLVSTDVPQVSRLKKYIAVLYYLENQMIRIIKIVKQ